ncbi:DUF3373 family protein [Pseudobacteriovorax antillogorgiicola]|uniref:Uncharacterized protein n=1 Tax=Pseudobacteriovorax antillogorgiicola TaxID=1513793 RepID=A0A1Y6CQ97_9BACT|nr:DUF3373 family protein [Pseudobacteriovorax antillogorgiicola]TCS42115.1 uncharacterized protein DUF3373 [Pseudobacteriovorax antillogorgiicola]SMF83044.1 Protein of unknown function [Pseudobacteriovorax antillogorgiicola]
MKNQLLALALLAPSLALSSSIEDRVDELEMNALLNTVRFSGEFVTRADHIYDPYITQSKNTIDFSTGSIVDANTVYKGKSFNVHRSLFSLNMTAEISETLTFYGRMTASKLQNNFILLQDAPNQSADQNARTFAGTQIHLERAYFNWKILNSLSLSVGRLPTIEGGPTHIVLGESPRGTYPRLAYASNLDGYALTYSIGGFSIRGLYHPLSAVKANRGSSGYSYQPEWTLAGDRIRTDNELLTFMLEYSSPDLGFTRYFNFASQYFIINKLLVDDFSRDLPNTGASPIPGAVEEVEISSPLSINYISWVNYLEFSDIVGSGASLALTHVSTKSRGNKGSGFMANTAGEEKNGSAILLAAAYKLPLSALKNPIFGVEYLSSDQYYQFFNGLAWDPVGFHSTRGTASHIFWNQPLTTGLKLRVAHMMVDDKYSRGEFSGEPTELTGDAKGTVKTTYAELRLAF